jgi:predicted nucleic acid-binding protein
MGALEVIRVVLDTNVLVSGLLFGGTPGKLVDLWKTGRIQLLSFCPACSHDALKP